MRTHPAPALSLVVLLALALPASAQGLDVEADVRLETGASASSTTLPADDAVEARPDLVAAPFEPALPEALRVPDAPIAAPPASALAPLLEQVRVDAEAKARAPFGVEAASRSGGAEEDGSTGSPPGGVLDALPEPVAEAAPAALATVGILALLQALGGWRWVGAVGVALYSRLAKGELLDHATRDRVYKLVQDEPGIGLTEIGRRLGLGWGTLVYHLDRLERASFVTAERGGLHKCYFPVGSVSRETRSGLTALKSDTARHVAGFLVQRPGATQTELCQALGLSASAASKQVTKLEAAGLVRRERDWKTVHLYPGEQLPHLLGAEAASPRGMPVAAPLAA